VTKVNNGKNNINIINAKKILVASIALVFLLLSTIFIQNQTILLSLLSHQQQQQQSPSLSSFLSSPIPTLAHADKVKIKNKSLINDISDQLVKNNGNNGKDELQNILQQVQMQISLIAGQDKATNAIKQIESVVELNPNGPLAQSLQFLAKQQASGNIEDVNKVTTDIARYAASGGDNVVGLLEQTVAAAPSSSTIPPSPRQQQQQQQQPSQSPTSSSTIASFGNNSNNINDNSNASFMATSPQITSHVESQGSSTALSQTRGSLVSELPPYNAVQQNQQQIPQSQLTESQQQPQKQEDQQQTTLAVSSTPEGQPQNQPQSSIPLLINSQNRLPAQPQSIQNSSLTLPPSQGSLYPTYDKNGNNNAYDYNNPSNANNTANTAANSSPQSTIKITSSDQLNKPIYPNLSFSMSNSTIQQNQDGGREQVEQRIQEIMNQFNSVKRNDGATLPTYIQ
jgi:hypothetical protein